MVVVVTKRILLVLAISISHLNLRILFLYYCEFKNLMSALTFDFIMCMYHVHVSHPTWWVLGPKDINILFKVSPEN